MSNKEADKYKETSSAYDINVDKNLEHVWKGIKSLWWLYLSVWMQ